MSPGKFAEGTEVPPERSRMEIETILRRYGADQFVSGWDTTRVVLGFTVHDRQVKFVLPMPSINDIPTRNGNNVTLTPTQRMKKLDAEERRRWRCLALAIKAKLEVVEAGIAEFEDEFLAHIVMPDGRTVGEHARPTIAEAYATGRILGPMLALEAGS